MFTLTGENEGVEVEVNAVMIIRGKKKGRTKEHSNKRTILPF